MAKYRFSVSTNYIGSKVEEVFEIPDEELEGLSEEEQEEVVNEYFEEWVWNNINADIKPLGT